MPKINLTVIGGGSVNWMSKLMRDILTCPRKTGQFPKGVLIIGGRVHEQLPPLENQVKSVMTSGVASLTGKAKTRLRLVW